MRKTQSRARRALPGGGLFGRALIGLALLVVAMVVAACGAPSVSPATPGAQATAGTQATPAAATQAAPSTTTSTGPSAPAATAEPGSQDVGATANLSPAAKYTTHWKGDPNAKVTVIEISDFQ